MKQHIELICIKDLGHAWLEVPTFLLFKWGIQSQISRYSYIDTVKGAAYLEEDLDFATFVHAARQNAWSWKIEWIEQENPPLKKLPRYPYTVTSEIDNRIKSMMGGSA